MKEDDLRPFFARSGSMVYGLVREMAVATQILKCAQRFGLKAKHFDNADKMIENARAEKPFLVILDFEHCEVEAYKVLKEFRNNADSKNVPLIGFVTQSCVAVKSEAERAGCDRVYMKTEFGHELPDLITRYAR